MRQSISTIVCMATASLLSMGVANARNIKMAIGTYTDSGSYGVYSMQFDDATGTAIMLDSVEVSNPSYLVFSPYNDNIYAVSENDAKSSLVNAIAFNCRNGKMSLINSVPANGGAPCYITMLNSTLFTANYSSGSICVFPINKDGAVGKSTQTLKLTDAVATDKTRQASAHIHCVVAAPDEKHLFATNLGGDCIYRFDITGSGQHTKLSLTHTTTPVRPLGAKVQNGMGPRHLVFSPTGRKAFLINELSGMIVEYDYHNGNITPSQSAVADDAGARGSGDIQISPDGLFLYASNRLENDGIAIFSIGNDGTLTRIGYQPTGIHPRNLAISPNGKYVLAACRDSNVIEVYQRDFTTGLLMKLDAGITLKHPVCVKFANPVLF